MGREHTKTNLLDDVSGDWEKWGRNTYSLGEMAGERDERPRHFHTGLALEIASTHGIVDAHEMESLDGDNRGFF